MWLVHALTALLAKTTRFAFPVLSWLVARSVMAVLLQRATRFMPFGALAACGSFVDCGAIFVDDSLAAFTVLS